MLAFSILINASAVFIMMLMVKWTGQSATNHVMEIARRGVVEHGGVLCTVQPPVTNANMSDDNDF